MAANGIGIVYAGSLTYQLVQDPANTDINTPLPLVVAVGTASMSSAPTTAVVFDAYTEQGNRVDLAALLQLFEKYGGERT